MIIRTLNPVETARRQYAKLSRLLRRTKPISETSKCRAALAPFCVGDGVDIGFGGDPIVPHAICMDLPRRYASYAAHTQHLHGDAQHLKWFSDGSLDWVYSSHVLEDFPNTRAVLGEWIRVLRPGGRLILFIPDEQAYRAHCRAQGKPPNPHHIHAHFDMEHVKSLLTELDQTHVIHERYPSGVYSFELVAEKAST